MLHTSRHACVVVGVVVQVFGAVCIEQCDACSGDVGRIFEQAGEGTMAVGFATVFADVGWSADPGQS